MDHSTLDFFNILGLFCLLEKHSFFSGKDRARRGFMMWVWARGGGEQRREEGGVGGGTTHFVCMKGFL